MVTSTWWSHQHLKLNHVESKLLSPSIKSPGFPPHIQSFVKI